MTIRSQSAPGLRNRRTPRIEPLEPRRLLAVGFDQISLPAGDTALGSLATAADGSLWMTVASGTSKPQEIDVLRLDPATGQATTIEALPSGTSPIGLTRGPDGTIWMVAKRANGTGIATDFTSQGAINDALPDAPTSFAFGADGNLYASAQHTNIDGSHNGEILRLNPATIRVTTFPLTDTGQSLGSLTLGPDGSVWFDEADSSQIGKIAPDGEIALLALPSQVSSGSLTPGAGGAVYFASVSPGLVYGIATDGTAQLFSGMTQLYPQEYTAGAGDSVWFAASGIQSGIGKLAMSGNAQSLGQAVSVYDGGLPHITAYPQPDGEYLTSPAGLTSDGQGGCWYTIQAGTVLVHAGVEPFLSLTSDVSLTTYIPEGNVLQYGDQGSAATFTSTDPDAVASDFQAFIDRRPATVVAAGNGKFLVCLSAQVSDSNDAELNRLIYEPHAVAVSVADVHSVRGIERGAMDVYQLGNLGAPRLQNFKVEVGHEYRVYSFGNYYPGYFGTVHDSVETGTWSHQVLIEWGDGTTSTQYVGGDNISGGQVLDDHAYAAPGTYTVTLIDMGSDEAAAANCIVTVTDSPTIYVDDYGAQEDIGIRAVPGETFQGSVYRFAADEYDAVPSNFTAEINWGDGTSSHGTISLSNGFYSIAGTHAYDNDAAILGSVTILGVGTHPDGFFSPIEIHLSNPTISDARSITVNAIVGAESQFHFAFFDAYPTPHDPGDLVAIINYGDGLQQSAAIQPDPNGGYDVIGDHIYTAPGTKAFSVTIVSTKNASQSPVVVDGELQVSGEAPNQLQATEDSASELTVGSFQAIDSQSTAASYSATIDWGDGTASVATIVAGASAGIISIEGNHSYHRGGAVPVSATLSGASGVAIGVFSADVLVTPSPITIAAQVATGTEGIAMSGGQLAAFTSSDSQALAADFLASIDWGDGTTSAGTIRDDYLGGFDVLGTHTYIQGGDYHPVVTIATADGLPISSATAEAEIDFRPLAITSQPVSLQVGQTFSGAVASFASADADLVAADFSAQIDWGDGSIVTAGQVVADADGGYSVTGSHAFVAARSYLITVTIARVGVTAPNSIAKVSATVASPPPPVVTPPVTPVTPPASTTTSPSSPTTPVTPPASSTSSPSTPAGPLPISAVAQAARNGTVQIVLTNVGTMAGVQASNAASYRVTLAGRDGKFGTKDDRLVKLLRVVDAAGSSSITLVPRGTFARGTVFSVAIGGKESVKVAVTPPPPKPKMVRVKAKAVALKATHAR